MTRAAIRAAEFFLQVIINIVIVLQLLLVGGNGNKKEFCRETSLCFSLMDIN